MLYDYIIGLSEYVTMQTRKEETIPSHLKETSLDRAIVCCSKMCI